MKKFKLPALLVAFTVLSIFINCGGDSEVDIENCSDSDYKVIRSIYGKGNPGDRAFYLRTGDEQPFSADVTVTFTVLDEISRFPGYVVEVPKGAQSNYLLWDSNTDNFSYIKIELTDIVIDPQDCEGYVEKDEDDVDADTQEASCGNLVDLTVYPCTDDYTLEWSGENLSGYTLEIYGKEINLGTQSSVTYAVSELDLDKGAGVITNGTTSCDVVDVTTGSCEAEPTCSDGIQNGDETGVDCGGSCENACTTPDVTYNEVSYSLEYGSYIDFENGTIYFYMYDNADTPAFYIDINLSSTGTIVSETYTVGGATYSVDAANSYVKVGNEAGDGDVVTSGSVVLTIGETEYTLDMDLTTSVSTLVGSYTIPFE